MSTLLTMKLEDNETLKDYSIRFWETYNDIEACGEEVAITTFKMGLPPIRACANLSSSIPPGTWEN